MIDLAILGLLREQDLHGYELKKRLGELLGGRSISFGSLYPALARLEKGGLLAAVDAASDPGAPGPSGHAHVPSSGSLKGELAAFRAARHALRRGNRGKKVYSLTSRGMDRLHELLNDPTPTDDRTFALRVAFCGHLPPAARLDLFERRRAQLHIRLAEQRQAGQHNDSNDNGRDHRRDRYLRSLREHDTQTIEHDLAWLDRLIAGERQAAQ